MPIRMLRDWTDSEPVNSLEASAERLFVRLIMKADDFGRFTANPKLIRALCFPLMDGLRESDISRDLAACEAAGLIATYSATGKPLLEIVNFGQRLRSAKSKYPPPVGSNSLTNDGDPPPELNRDGGGREGNGIELNTPPSPPPGGIEEFNKNRRPKNRFHPLQGRDPPAVKAWIAQHPESLIQRDRATVDAIVRAAAEIASDFEFYEAVDRIRKGG